MSIYIRCDECRRVTVRGLLHLPGCGDAGWSDEDAAVEG